MMKHCWLFAVPFLALACVGEVTDEPTSDADSSLKTAPTAGQDETHTPFPQSSKKANGNGLNKKKLGKKKLGKKKPFKPEPI